MILALICTLLIVFFSFHTYQSIQMLKTKISLVKIGLLYTKSLQASYSAKLLNPCSPAADPGAIIETSFSWLPYLGAGVAVLVLVSLSLWFYYKGKGDSGDLPPSLESINKLFDEGVYVKAAEEIPPRRDPSELYLCQDLKKLSDRFDPEDVNDRLLAIVLEYIFGDEIRLSLSQGGCWDEVADQVAPDFVKVVRSRENLEKQLFKVWRSTSGQGLSPSELKAYKIIQGLSEV